MKETSGTKSKDRESDQSQANNEQPSKKPSRFRWLLLLGLAIAAGGGTAIALTLRKRAVVERKRDLSADADRVSTSRIPLREVIQFRNRQWYREDMENAIDGDAPAMLRLAKMCYYGQGCPKSTAACQEWLMRARRLGFVCSMSELLSGGEKDKDPSPFEFRSQSQRPVTVRQKAHVRSESEP